MLNKVKKYLKVMLLVNLVVWSAAIYFSVSPYSVNTYELKNGNKTIIFQEMVHVGSDNYYRNVNKKIEDYRKQGFVLYYELIKINNKEELAEMKELIGINNEAFTKILNKTNLEHQQDHMFKPAKNDVHADIDSKELVTRLKAHYAVNNNDKIDVDKEAQRFNSMFVNVDVSEKYSEFFAKAFFRIGLKINSLLRLDPVNANDVIIKQRNDVLISKIYNGGDEKIFIQYGAFHFEDFAEQMKKQGFEINKIDTLEVF